MKRKIKKNKKSITERELNKKAIELKEIIISIRQNPKAMKEVKELVKTAA